MAGCCSRLEDMPTVVNNQTYYRTSEACQRAGISKATFFRRLKRGILEDVAHKDKRGLRLFTQDDINRINSGATQEEGGCGRQGRRCSNRQKADDDLIILYKEASAADALHEAKRLKTELLSNVSHELRTPLTSIKGYCTAILTHYDRLTDEEKIDFLREIDQASDKLTELIEGAMQLFRLETGGLPVQKKPVEIVPIIEDAIKGMEQKAGRYHFVTRLAEPLPVVEADPGCIRQVLDNLLSNAVKFSPEDREISVGCESKEQELIVSVQDQGIGISPQEIDKVFDRFYQAASGLCQKPAGAGLGLTLCKHMIEAHGGRIWVESRPWEGSTFYFTIPIQNGSEGHSHCEETSNKDYFDRGGRYRHPQVRRPSAGTRRLPRASS
jgi:signal transduction histidine kinase